MSRTADGKPTKSRKNAKLSPKLVFGVLFGTIIIFVVSFALSYFLMYNKPTVGGTKDLQEENEELKAKIEFLEEKLEKYEGSDDFASEEVPDEYTGATIVPGGSEPADNDKEDSEKDDEDGNEEDSAFEGVIEDDEPSEGVSDAPVELN